MQLHYVFECFKRFSTGNMKSNDLERYIYFLVDCDSIDVDDILNIHKVLMVINNIK